MIVSLAVTALIALLLVQSLQTTGLITRNAQRLAAQEEVTLVRGHLRRTLATVVRRRRDGRRVPFLGQDGRLMATIGANHEAERDAETLFGLGVTEAPDGAGLMLIETGRTGSETDGTDRSEVLLDRIVGLRLRYFGVQGQSGPADRLPRWDTAWQRTDRLPALVEVTVEFHPADTRRWPALIVPLGAGS
jgi:general secretion pathway protein J